MMRRWLAQFPASASASGLQSPPISQPPIQVGDQVGEASRADAPAPPAHQLIQGEEQQDIPEGDDVQDRPAPDRRFSQRRRRSTAAHECNDPPARARTPGSRVWRCSYSKAYKGLVVIIIAALFAGLMVWYVAHPKT